MLDLETMGVSDNAAIMSIGACYFDINTGAIGECFHQQVSLASCVERGMVIDTSTVLWWMKQSDEARSKFYDNGKCKSLSEVLTDFSAFVVKDAEVWGNGSCFDNTILRNAYRSAGFIVPWEFWNDRDVRTIVAMGKMIGFDPKTSVPFMGVRHDALADAMHQAKYVSLIWDKLKNA